MLGIFHNISEVQVIFILKYMDIEVKTKMV